MDKIEGLIESVKQLDIGKQRVSPRDKQVSTTPKSTGPWARAKLKTGLVFDDFMAKHDCFWTKSDECPQRYECVRDRIKHYGLVDQCHVLESQAATKEQVLLAHDEQYYELVKSTKGETDLEKLKNISQKFDGIYFNEFTYDIAMLALGSSIKLTEAVLDQQEIRNGFAVIRTPGHHAQRAEANGFCFFNNAAIVAKHCIRERRLKRILIIDWDVHHGQGTQSFFYDDPQVLYVSIHRYEKGKFWPELIESNFNFTGRAQGKGYNLNIPLNETGCNDIDYLLIWLNIIMPVAYEFNPELVIVSAGFDAAIGCPEGHMRVKPITFHVLCHSLMSLADGKVVALLEGGYNLLSLAESAAMTLRALLGYPCPRLDSRFIEMTPHQSVIQTILDLTWAIRPQWQMLRLQGYFERFKPEESCGSPGGDVEGRPRYKPVATYEGTASHYSENKPENYDLQGVCCIKDEAEQASLRDEITTIIAQQDLSSSVNASKGRTLLIYDDFMTKHKCHESSHPEKPERYLKIKARLNATGLLERCAIGKARKATEEELALGHDKAHIDLLKSTRGMSGRELLELGNSMDSIYINAFTYDCALLAAGCAIEAVDTVMSRTYANSFALIRPPGHHASADTAAGFCFFNNVVVAAKHALKHYPDTCKRILMIDYDFHHGNGVQRMVQDDENILYISLHGFNDGYEYPGEQLSNYTTGSKNIINVPWNEDRMTDTEYILAYLSIVLPAAYEFNPDLVLVSSGFDAAIHDPLGRYKVSPAAFGHFIHHLLPLASGRLVACLEGGYNLDSISESAAHVVSVLLGDPPRALSLKQPPSQAAILSIKNVISYHKSNYKTFCFDVDLPSDELAE